MTSRRSFLTGAAATLIGLAAPAVIRTPGLLMPVRKLIPPKYVSMGLVTVSGRTAYVKLEDKGSDLSKVLRDALTEFVKADGEVPLRFVEFA